MKKTIFKYELKATNKQTIKLPYGSKILSVGVQGAEVYIWALVIPDAELEERVFEIFGTGHDIPYDIGVDREFVGTFQISKGNIFVGHVFERRN